MLILFDNNIPHGLLAQFAPGVATEARERGWDTLKNGALLKEAEQAGFDLLLTADKNLSYQQNLAGRKIALLVLSHQRWQIVQSSAALIASTALAASPGSFFYLDLLSASA